MKISFLPPLIFLFFLLPVFAQAANFEQDLFFGLKDNEAVRGLQQFLKREGVYQGPITGNFFSLTMEGVRKFQEREKISPPAGFFGPKTRARANELLEIAASTKEETMAALAKQIAGLQARIAELQEKLKAEESAEAVQAPAAEESKPEPAQVKKLIIKGGKEMAFPETATASLNLGDIVLTNGTDNDVFLAQIQLKITDNMDSPLNRNKNIFFILRSGTSTADTEISRTRFTFNSNSPISSVYGPHTTLVNLSLPETMKAGESRTFGLWIDNLNYVVRGSLDMEFNSILTVNAAESEGSFKFKLTK